MSNHLYQRKTITRINKKLKLLNSKYSTLFVLNTRLLISLIVLVFSVLFFDIGFILGPLLAIIIYYLFEFIFLDLKIKKRVRRLNEESLPFFEMLFLVLKKDNLLQAIDNVSNIMDTEIAKSFRKVVNEVSLGKSLNSSLDSLKSILPSQEIKLLIVSLQNTNIEILKKELEEQIKVLHDKNELYSNYKIKLISIKGNLITILFIVVFIIIVVYQLSILNLFK